MVVSQQIIGKVHIAPTILRIDYKTWYYNPWMVCRAIFPPWPATELPMLARGPICKICGPGWMVKAKRS
jgi:hypothetical protein